MLMNIPAGCSGGWTQGRHGWLASVGPVALAGLAGLVGRTARQTDHSTDHSPPPPPPRRLLVRSTLGTIPLAFAAPVPSPPSSSFSSQTRDKTRPRPAPPTTPDATMIDMIEHRG